MRPHDSGKPEKPAGEGGGGSWLVLGLILVFLVALGGLLYLAFTG